MLLLGPGHWRRFGRLRASPMRLRRLVRTALGHPCVLMEEEPDLPGEDVDLAAKFKRLLAAHDHAAIVVVWPRGAKMAAVQDELLLLVEWQRLHPLPPVFLLHHPAAARVAGGAFEVLERGGRSRYMTAFQLLPVWPLPWRSGADLLRAVAAVRDEIGSRRHRPPSILAARPVAR